MEFGAGEGEVVFGFGGELAVVLQEGDRDGEGGVGTCGVGAGYGDFDHAGLEVDFMLSEGGDDGDQTEFGVADDLDGIAEVGALAGEGHVALGGLLCFHGCGV